MQLAFSLVFLYTISLNGMSRALCDLAKIKNSRGTDDVPRGRFPLCHPRNFHFYLLGGYTSFVEP